MSRIEKPSLNIAVIGLIDSGKPTSTRHLIYKLGGIDPRTIEKFEKVNRPVLPYFKLALQQLQFASLEAGKGLFKYAWILDRLKAERERGVTINDSIWTITTAKYKVNFIDAPGRRDPVNLMFGSTPPLDAAILVVPGEAGAFTEDKLARGHALLAHFLGINQLVVCINRNNSSALAEAQYQEVASQVSEYVRKIGYDLDQVLILPISGVMGDNIATASRKWAWYQGWQKAGATGNTLLEALDAIVLHPRPDDLPLRLPLQDVYKINGGTFPVGRVESGVIKPGMEITFAPSGIITKVISLEMHKAPLEHGVHGDNVNFNVDVYSKQIRRGMVVGAAKQDPPMATTSFTARVIVLDHPTPIQPGYIPTVDCHTSHTPCKFVELLEKVDKETNEVLELKLRELKSGEAARVRMEPQKPVSSRCSIDSHRWDGSLFGRRKGSFLLALYHLFKSSLGGTLADLLRPQDNHSDI